MGTSFINYAAPQVTAEAFWYAYTGDLLVKAAVGVSESVYVAGYPLAGTSTVVMKFDGDGALTWRRTAAKSPWSSYTVTGLAVDSSENVYVVGKAWDGVSAMLAYVIKYNSAGTLQWQRVIEYTTQPDPKAVCVDVSGNVYIAFEAPTPTYMRGYVVKYNSSGTLQWQKNYYQNSARSTYTTGLVADSSGNVYAAGQYANGGTNAFGYLLKLDSSGSAVWARETTTDTAGYGALAVDGSDNIYAASAYYRYSGANNGFVVWKYNSAGVAQWSYTAAFSTTSSTVVSLAAVDGMLYLCGSTQQFSTTATDWLISKLSTAGVSQWNRVFGKTGSTNDTGTGVAVMGSKFYAVGTSGATPYAVVAKLPTDGTKAGATYSGHAYNTLSLSAGITIAEQASSLTVSTASLTDSAGSMTDAAGSTSRTIVTIP